jgi:hypothetical protein
VVTPLDAATSDDAHDAKLAIELGAAELIVGRLTGEQLGRFQERRAPLPRTLKDAGSPMSMAASPRTTPSTGISSRPRASGRSSRPTSSSACPV